MTERYATIARRGEAVTEVKRSRFLGVAERVDTEQDARAVIDAARKEHWDARHRCSAFVLGPDGQVARSNDDGEPSGTAGAPILRAVQGHGVSDVVVVVTRWFGGVLLGAGGLVRAYGDAAVLALEDAGLVQRGLLREVRVSVGPGDAGRLEHTLRGRGYAVDGVDYGSGRLAVVRLSAPSDGLAELGALVDAESRGTGSVEALGERWTDLP
ncbi:IMPACT family protein [Actinomycetota bacterium]